MTITQHLTNHFDVQEMLQEKLLGSDWRDKVNKTDLVMAILSELAELLDSISFKWWTKKEEDWENAKIEVIDIYHFLLVWALLEGERWDREFLAIQLEEGFNSEKRVKDKEKIKKTIQYMLLDLNLGTVSSLFYYIGRLAKLAGFRHLYEFSELYIKKALLNEDRKKRGYDRDESRKYIGGREDNELLKGGEK
ncbi:hypothetical protein JCM9492_11260 [Aquifex pyrophilus]